MPRTLSRTAENLRQYFAMVPKPPFKISLFEKEAKKVHNVTKIKKTKVTFTLTTFKVVRVKVVLFFSISNV